MALSSIMIHHDHDRFPEPTRPPNAPSPGSNVLDHEQPSTQLDASKDYVKSTDGVHHPLPEFYAATTSSSSSSSSASTPIRDDDETSNEAIDKLLSMIKLSTEEEKIRKFIFERMKQSKAKAKALTELYERMSTPQMESRNVVESADHQHHTDKLERFKVKILDFEDEDLTPHSPNNRINSS